MWRFRHIAAAVLATSTAVCGTANAGSASVTLGNETYSLDTATCEGGPESFSVQASVKTGAQLLQLGAFKGEVSSVGFRVGDTMAQVSDETGTFDGKTFRFEGEAQVFTVDSINRKKLSVTVTCDGG